VPSAIVSTVGGSASNSYLSLAELLVLLDDGPNAGLVSSTTTADQTRALLQATARLDLESWTGVRVNQTQKLAWPRNYAVDPDKTNTNVGSTYARPYDMVVYLNASTIPDRIRSACAELAVVILQAGSGVDPFANDPSRDILIERIGSLMTQYRNESPQREDALSKWPRVWRAIEPLLESSQANKVERK
jgi:hypothetical protein